MALCHVDYGWWLSTYEFFEELFKDVFGDELDTKRLYFDMGRAQGISYNTTLRPTAESLAKATNYGKEVQDLADRVSGLAALYKLAGYSDLWITIESGEFTEVQPDSYNDEEEYALIDSMVPDLEEWVQDLSHWMLKTLEAEYYCLCNLPEEEEEEAA